MNSRIASVFSKKGTNVLIMVLRHADMMVLTRRATDHLAVVLLFARECCPDMAKASFPPLDSSQLLDEQLLIRALIPRFGGAMLKFTLDATFSPNCCYLTSRTLTGSVEYESVVPYLRTVLATSPKEWYL